MGGKGGVGWKSPGLKVQRGIARMKALHGIQHMNLHHTTTYRTHTKNGAQARPTDTGGADTRVVCTTCRHHRPAYCANYRAAGLMSPDLSTTFAALPQHCPAYSPQPGANDTGATTT
jgi:hypothetical protein